LLCVDKNKKKANQHVPALVTHLQGQRIVLVACGEAHTLGVTKQGGVWSCGLGERGRLGHGDEVVYACITHIHTYTWVMGMQVSHTHTHTHGDEVVYPCMCRNMKKYKKYRHMKK